MMTKIYHFIFTSLLFSLMLNNLKIMSEMVHQILPINISIMSRLNLSVTLVDNNKNISFSQRMLGKSFEKYTLPGV